MAAGILAAVGTPHMSDYLDEVTPEALRRLTRFPSLKRTGMTRQLPEDLLQPDEDARVLVVRGIFYRKEAAAAFVLDRSLQVTLRADPENEHDPFAVAVDIDGVHVGFLAREVAIDFQPLVSQGAARVAALWSDFSRDVPLIYLLVAWHAP